METHCKKCNKVQKVSILWAKQYPEMRLTTNVVSCTVCNDRFLVFDKRDKQLNLFETPKIA